MIFFNIILLVLDIFVSNVVYNEGIWEWKIRHTMVVIFVHVFAAYLFARISNHISKIKSTVGRGLLTTVVWLVFLLIYMVVMWYTIVLLI